MAHPARPCCLALLGRRWSGGWCVGDAGPCKWFSKSIHLLGGLWPQVGGSQCHFMAIRQCSEAEGMAMAGCGMCRARLLPSERTRAIDFLFDSVRQWLRAPHEEPYSAECNLSVTMTISRICWLFHPPPRLAPASVARCRSEGIIMRACPHMCAGQEGSPWTSGVRLC